MNKRMIAQGVCLEEKPNSNRNELIVGSSGSGKTGSYLASYLQCAEDESIIVADTKMNLYRKFKPYLESKGYRVFNLNLVEPDKGCGYDPLDYVRYTEKYGKRAYNQKDIITLSQVLCPLSHYDREPFWTQQAQMVISILICYVLEEMEGKDKNMTSVLDVFRALCRAAESGEDYFLSDYVAKHPDSFGARRYEMISSGFAADKTWACIKLYVTNALQVFEFDAAREMLTKKSGFSLKDLGEKKTVLFLNISDSDRSLDPIANIFYTQALNVLLTQADKQPNSKLKVPVRIILDDFASNAYIPDFDKIISVVRSRDISVSCIVQALSQLYSYYNTARANTIVNNCSVFYYLGGQDMDTVRYISMRANIALETVMALPCDKAILFQSGEKPMKVTKIVPYSMMKDLEIETIPTIEDDSPDRERNDPLN